MGRIIFALLALVGLGVVAGVGGYYALKRSDIPYQTLAAKYETAASRYADLPNGVRLHYFDAGKQNGPVLVLLHGFTASAHSWDQWSDRLRQDYHIIAIDLPGHGLTRTPPGYRASAEAFRDTLAEFVRARGLGRFALIGNSLGGRVAWEYALAFPDHVEALVLVDAAGWPDPRAAALLQSPAYHALQDPTLGPLLRDLDQTALLRQGLLAAFANDAMVDDTMVSRYADLSRAPGHRSVLLALQGQVATQSYASPETSRGVAYAGVDPLGRTGCADPASAWRAIPRRDSKREAGDLSRRRASATRRSARSERGGSAGFSANQSGCAGLYSHAQSRACRTARAMSLHRRSFLAGASLVAAPLPAFARDLARGRFTHGVASGDPLPRSVILWTRFLPERGERIAWEISDQENFTHVTAYGTAGASARNDYCVKIDARGLRPGRRYFYRFLSASGPSVTGLTRTAPENGFEPLNIALFSCANMPFGYFHAYGHAAARDEIDLVIHVGDYIYELPRGTYPSAQDALPSRIIAPENELVSLSDYHARYASYHADADLLELRRRKPISAVWDDHEIANDTWARGAQSHNPQSQGDFSARIAAAARAYFDWMPVRRPEPGLRLYRALDWGDLARIVLLDARFIGRDQQLQTPRRLIGGREIISAKAAFEAELNAPNRTMLGAPQEQWLTQQLSASKARGQTWQVIAQQVVLGRQNVPQGFTRFLPPDISPQAARWFVEGEAMSQLGLPWNLDNWNGYPAARTRFLEGCTAHANNVIVLSGDSHNCWLNNHVHADRLAAIEFAGGSVTSPGIEKTLTNARPGEREVALRAGNPALAWCDMTRRGYGALRLTRGACEAEWTGFDSVREARAPAPIVTRFSSEASAGAGPSAWSVQA